jgi:dTDP-4-amino-4,6-dideoxy-D-galactose acyltransferase
VTAPAGAPAGAALLTPLPWDGEVIGRPVARAGVAGLPAAAVREVLDAARGAAPALVYLFGDPADAPALALLDEAGAALVDRRTTYARPVDPAFAGSTPAGVVAYHGGWPDSELRALALASGLHSRFRVDPRLPSGAFERIYETWIARSVAGELAEAVFVAPAAGGAGRRLDGMVTVGVKDGRADIGLLAVAPEARGRGVGRALVRAAQAWAAGRGFAAEQVVTQGANGDARRLYEACGYHVESAVAVRHLWCDR